MRLNGMIDLLHVGIRNSTITHSVNYKPDVAVVTGRGAVTGGVMTLAGISPQPVNTDGIYVFALS